MNQTQNKINYESIVLSFEHPRTKQKFKIVNAYKLYHNYVDRVKNSPDNSNSDLDIYKEEVIKPIYSACFKDGEYLHMVYPILNKAPEDLGEIQAIVEKIETNETDQIIREALIKSSDLLPSDNETTVCVLPNTNLSSYMVTVGAGKIIVLYNSAYTEDALRAGVAHEYHHSVWTTKHRSENKLASVLDNLIFEGKAVMFEKLVYPDITFTPVDLTYNKEYWSKIVLDLDKYDFNKSIEIIMGGKELPWLYGYSEGYKMVKSYLESNPNVTISEWTGMSPQDIFEKGKYLENYK